MKDRLRIHRWMTAERNSIRSAMEPHHSGSGSWVILKQGFDEPVLSRVEGLSPNGL
jgi:hypothetical protein